MGPEAPFFSFRFTKSVPGLFPFMLSIMDIWTEADELLLVFVL